VIEAAWLLAAIELNGALVSRGAKALLSDTNCAVEYSAIAPALSAAAKKQQQGDFWVTKPEQCSYSETDSLLRIRLSQDALATRVLTLSESSGLVSVALLHNTSLLAEHAEFSSQPAPMPIPSAAFDVFAGSGLQGVGGILSSGPWSLHALHQQAGPSPAAQRLTLDYFFEEGSHARVGDFRTDYGVEQRFGEFRGISFASKAAPLRGDGKAQAQLAIENRSRVQFFDRNGIAVYSSEVLPPGNYQVQGYGASTIPGFLEARLVDVNGVVQSVALPWSADRRILSAQQTEWEFFSGRARSSQGLLKAPIKNAARFRYGLTQHLTFGLHADWEANDKRLALEASTRALPSLIATAALGQACETGDCLPTWRVEARADIRKKAFLAASLERAVANAVSPTTTHIAQISLSGAWSNTLSGSLHIAAELPQTGPAQQTHTISASLRLNPRSSLTLQARHQLFANEGSAWVGTLGLTVSFASRNTTASGHVQQRAGRAGQRGGIDYTVQASKNSPSAYGPQLSLAHTQGQRTRSDAFGRYASAWGDVSARADSLSNRLDWSASTRLWITPEAVTLGPTGEHNLVIHQLGLAAVKIEHAGSETQRTDAKGKALFRKSPAWTDSRYSIDSKSVPFGINLSVGAVKVPLAVHRAYLVDYRALWSATQAWQIANARDFGNSGTFRLEDRHGRAVYISEEGFVDLNSSSQLPLTLVPRDGRRLQCEALTVQQSVTQLHCRSTTPFTGADNHDARTVLCRTQRCPS
jgi:hypothetical protein